MTGYIDWEKEIKRLEEVIGEQQATISALKEENEQLRQRYYALKKENDRLENNIIHLNEANDFRKKNLKIMELSDTEHNLKMLLANSDEQTERFIKGLQDENEQLRQQLQCNKMSKSVCSVCKNHRLEQVSDMYYVSKCEKGHNECSKTMLRCCEDFEVLNDE